jgi:hypothetical protein
MILKVASGSPVAIDIIIESKLFMYFNVSFGKNAHAQMRSHYPAGSIAVWITAVIGEPPYAAFFGCVDKLKIIDYTRRDSD